MTKTELSKSTKSVLVDMVLDMGEQLQAALDVVSEQKVELEQFKQTRITQVDAVVADLHKKLNEQVATNEALMRTVARLQAELDSIPYEDEYSNETTDPESGDVQTEEKSDRELNIEELTKRLRIKQENQLWNSLLCKRDHDRFAVWFPQDVYGGTDPEGHKRVSQQCYNFLGKLASVAKRRGATRVGFERTHLVIVVQSARSV